MGEKIGICDFYESLCSITRINAAVVQGFRELSYVHTPENGMASSSMELCYLQICRALMRKIIMHSEEKSGDFTKSTNVLEEDFYL